MSYPVQPLSHLGVRSFPFLGTSHCSLCPPVSLYPGFLLEAFKAGGSREIRGQTFEQLREFRRL